jgi:flagellar biosynthesis protein FliP
MSKAPKIIGIILIVAGAVMIPIGAVTYYLVHDQLSDEKITVSDDAANFAGEPVEGPFTAYAEANVIKEHASEIADGLTYAQLEQDDPRRDSVMTSSFLRASLFTSVVAFGVAFLVGALGVLFILIGIAIMSIAKAVAAPAPPGAHSAGPDAEPVAAFAPASTSSSAFAPPADDRP